MTEDEIYRTSTQYRLWSFTPDSISAQRIRTNALAAKGVRAAIQSLPSARPSANPDANDSGTSSRLTPAEAVDCLSVEEEQKLVGYYCIQAMKLADFCDFPTNVKVNIIIIHRGSTMLTNRVQATAVQYLKRFYLSNSPMTYHPKEMMPSALFLATKTENHYTSLRSFTAKLGKLKEEDVVAPEFLLTQGLRFTFDVRHPQRGLEGGFMELLALANGKAAFTPAPTSMGSGQDHKAMLDIDAPRKGGDRAKSAADLVLRVQHAHGKAKDLLKTLALLTDAYFLYTPSQIWLSSLFIVDQPLAHFYLGMKILPVELKEKVSLVLKQCAGLLQSSISAEPGQSEMSELTRIDKKLYKCRNPEKIDLVSIHKSQKRDGDGKGSDSLDEKIVKKRKLERENSLREAEAVFGPSLAKDM